MPHDVGDVALHTRRRRTMPRWLFAGATLAARPLSLALQGGGAFGAFTWGVLDRLLRERSVAFDTISGTSAGAINAVVLADGLAEGGALCARERLERFWRRVAETAAFPPFASPAFSAAVPPLFDFSTRWFSPYQLNPLDLNPLRDILAAEIDFNRL